MMLVSVLKSGDAYAQLAGNPTLDSLDGERRAPLQTLLSAGWSDEDRTAFGLYLVDVTAPEGMRWSRSFTDFEGLPVATFEPVPASTRVTKTAFRNRFTTAEKVTLELASLDNPAASMAQRQQAAMLRVGVADSASATFIDLARPDTRAGVQVLESAGILAAGRALEILDSPVQPAERPL